MSDTQNSTAELSGKRKELLEALLQQRERVVKAKGGIPRRQNSGPVPLSFAQERLWFFDQYYPGSTLYNIPSPIPFTGDLNPQVMRAALNEIVQRHESLRTVFRVEHGRPVQVILPHLELELPVVDLQSMPEGERNQALAQLLHQESNHVFSLSNGPMLRAVLICMQKQFHYLLLVMHHIVSDAWSLTVFMRELQQLCWAFSQGQASPLPALAIQYQDFSVWQRDWLQGEVLQSQLEYWKQELSGTESLMLEMPSDQQRPATLSFRGANISFWLSSALSEKIRALVQETQTTPFMVLLTGFFALLFRYTGQTSLVVGFPTANRNRSELEGLIGFFVNSLPLHVRHAEAMDLRQLLAQVRTVTLGALAHQDIPFEKLVQELQPARNLNTNPLFQAMFDFHNSMNPGDQQPASNGAEEMQETGLQSAMGTGTSKFDLCLSMISSGRQFGGTLEFSTDLFEEATMRRFITHYQHLLRQMIEKPEKPIALLEMMTQAEKQQVLGDWTNTDKPFAADQCLHELFERQVERMPGAVAAIFENQPLTYAKLNERANQLAWLLRSKGVGPDSIVATCMESCIEFMVSILGILKAGGAYLPLDPTYPQGRITLALRDAAVKIVLIKAGEPDWMAHTVETVLPVDSVQTNGDSFPSSNPPRLAIPENACCVIYKSWAEEEPKGVVIEHKSVLNAVNTLIETFSLGEGTRILQFSSPSSDISIIEIFEGLLSGGSLYLGSQDAVAAGEPLLQFLKEHAIHVATMPPSVWAHLTHAEMPDLKVAVAYGEALPPIVVKRWGSSRTFFNAYGAAENTVISSAARCLPDTKSTIGRPLANCQYYIVDRNFQPCAIGVAGELMIAGAGLARGYVGRLALTAEHFVPNPFSSLPGSRLYRTGDLVRFLPNGEVDYLGRIDGQIKINGFRIELSEIEVTLCELSSIAAAAVTVFVDPSGRKNLAAYIVPKDPESAPSSEVVRAHLVAKLPQYMVPQYYLLLQEIPRTPNGKLDVHALPSPGKTTRRQVYVPPRNPLEQVLAGIWREILKVSQLGVHDNFFDMGGHSLVVMQIVSRVRDTLGAELPVRAIFETPTIADLAHSLLQDPDTAESISNTASLLVQLEALDQQESSPVTPPIDTDHLPQSATGNGLPPASSAVQALPDFVPPTSSKTPAPLSFAQERLWFLDHFQPGNTSYNVLAPFPWAEPVNVPILTQALQQMVQRHEVLRTVFGLEQGQPVQIVQSSTSIDLHCTDLRHLPLHEARTKASALASEQARSPFDLARGPLLRAFLFQIGPQENLFALAIHHVISDAWSLNIFFSELVTIYRALCSGKNPALPPLEAQYSDFARWQRQWLTGPNLEKKISYWRRQLADAPPILEFPLDYPRPVNTEFRRGGTEFLKIPESTILALEKIARPENATLFMVLLAAFKVLLYRYTGQDHIVVGTPIANRNRREFEALIGFFVNTLVLHTDLSGDPSFRELLARVRKVTLDAYSHQELPFERLVAELNPERTLNVSPLFQVMFILQKGPIVFRSGNPGSDELQALALQQSVAKFDLTFYLEEIGNEILGFVEFDVNLFHRQNVKSIISHFEILLERIAQAADQPISRVSLLSEAERKALLHEPAQPLAPPEISAAHHFVEIQAKKTPSALAITGPAKITYSELNARANQLARVLRELGVASDVCVGVDLERGPDLLLALLAVLKAGGAYLPIDLEFPSGRIALMIAQAGVPLVLTSRKLAVHLENCSSRLQCIEDLDSLLAAQSTENLPWNGCKDNLSYVIYTSGSTGTPKCVGLPHATLINLIAWQLQATHLSAPAATVQYSSPSFDVCLQEVFATWANGGSLVCISEEQHRDPAALCKAMVAEEVKRIYLPFVALQQLAEYASSTRAKLPPLQEVLTAGEQLRITPRILGLFAKLKDCTLINHYGPSESHVVTAYDLGADQSLWQGLPPIGSAAAGARLYVLDASGELAPLGVPGELYLGGDSLARGYLNDPAATAQRFVPDPFSGVAGSRMYQTGDIVRYDVAGLMHFMHRKDQQVKIRGFRVELGEIEHHLSHYPGVAEVAVTTWRRTGSYDARLVAYVVPQPRSELNPLSMAEFLKRELPDYMIPADFVFLDSLPLTATGKLARNRLPQVERARGQTDKLYIAPRTPMEQQLVAFWSELLGLTNPSVEDSFFELGGHSLLVTQLVSKIAEQFQVEVPVRQVFETPTVAQLAVFIMKAQAQQGAATTLEALLEEVEEISDEDAFKLLLAQENTNH